MTLLVKNPASLVSEKTNDFFNHSSCVLLFFVLLLNHILREKLFGIKKSSAQVTTPAGAAGECRRFMLWTENGISPSSSTLLLLLLSQENNYLDKIRHLFHKQNFCSFSKWKDIFNLKCHFPEAVVIISL